MRKIIYFLMAILISVCCLSSISAEARDPTKPLVRINDFGKAVSAETDIDTESDVAPELILQAVFNFQKNWIAIINGKAYHIGEIFEENYEVKKITSRTVTIYNQETQELIELSVYPEIIKKK